jgi:eukaryotic-like serine/threonine-protein kinase
MSHPSERDDALFAGALALPAAERRAYLDAKCSGDAAQRQRIDVLLGSHEQAGDFMSASALPSLDGFSLPGAGIEHALGERVGRYKLLDKIGEGGWGVVYQAEQEEPVRRRVALKVIKLGMDTAAVVARFEAERQALALMEHPNIARVFDGGATESGRPYFVMELVSGVAITDYCDQQRLTTRERLALLAQVCHAVQHAHQKGIIHRDLKPSNILVTRHDHQPVPKIIDFGIAKATEQRLTEKTFFTSPHQFVGTPAYMSPEQTGGRNVDIDTRSDIYSLGVLLYELLTGRTPFDARELLENGYEEILRTIRETELPRPSIRLTSLNPQDLATAAQRRRLAGAELVSTLRGDLDWIVMKCLQKDRVRRYESADALALDLARFLDHQPVLARPDSFSYRTGKFLRRNRVPMVTTAVIAGLLVTVIGFYTARLADERNRARQEAAKAERVSAFLTSLFTGANPYRAPEPDTLTARGLLDAGVERIEKELAGQPELLAEMSAVIGRVYMRLGLHQKARPLLERALAVQRQNGTSDERIAQTLDALGILLRERGERDQARVLLAEALDIQRARDRSGNATAAALVELGRVYHVQGMNKKAEPLLREALEIRRRVLGEENRETGVAYGDLGIVLMQEDDYEAAEPLVRQALAIYRKGLGDHPNLAGAISNFAQTLLNKGDFAGAEALFRESAAMFRRNLGDKHWRVANVLSNLSHPLREQGKHDEAIAVAEEAMAIEQASLGRGHPLFATALVSLARAEFDRGNFSRAESLLREALPVFQGAYGDDNPRTAGTKSVLGAALIKRQQFAEAETLLLSAHAVLKGKSGPEAKNAKTNRAHLVALYETWGQPDKARHFQAEKSLEPSDGADRPKAREAAIPAGPAPSPTRTKLPNSP